MYIRLVVKYCNAEKRIIAKEAHTDSVGLNSSQDVIILNSCMEILNKKAPEIEKMVPAHLRNKDFEFIVYGNYLLGRDWIEEKKSWTTAEPIFNIQQLGLPEKDQPLIKIS